jgi:hypothetical protein
MFTNYFGQSIYVAKYLMIARRMPVPDPISFSLPYNHPSDNYYFLNREIFKKHLHRERAKQENQEYYKKWIFLKIMYVPC